MKIRSLAVPAVAVFATCSAFAAAPAPKPEPQPTPRAPTLLEDLGTGMRDVLRAVTPEVSLPKLEIKLPPLERAQR